jgi:hypothetical protein
VIDSYKNGRRYLGWFWHLFPSFRLSGIVGRRARDQSVGIRQSITNIRDAHPDFLPLSDHLAHRHQNDHEIECAQPVPPRQQPARRVITRFISDLGAILMANKRAHPVATFIECFRSTSCPDVAGRIDTFSSSSGALMSDCFHRHPVRHPAHVRAAPSRSASFVGTLPSSRLRPESVVTFGSASDITVRISRSRDMV